MDIREQIQWLRLQAETPNYMSSRERQRNSDTADTLEALNKVYLAAKGIRLLVETMNNQENMLVAEFDEAIEELEGKDE